MLRSLGSAEVDERVQVHTAVLGSPGQRGVVFAGAAALVLCGSGAGWLLGTASSSSRPASTIAVAPLPAPPSEPQGALSAAGHVIAKRQATVAAEVTGRVLAIFVEEGQEVREGQVLAVLEGTLANADLRSAQAREGAAEAELGEARRVLDRAQALANEGFVSNANLTAAQARLAVATAEHRARRSEASRAALYLSRYQIRAPFAGVVVSKDAQPGEVISPVSAGAGFTRTGICTIVDMHSLEIEVDVSEAYIARVSPGQRVRAAMDAYPNLAFAAHVIATIPAVSRDRATARVRIVFDQYDERIVPGMAVSATFLDASQQSVEAQCSNP